MSNSVWFWVAGVLILIVVIALFTGHFNFPG